MGEVEVQDQRWVRSMLTGTFFRRIDWPPVCLVVMSKASTRRAQNAPASAHAAEDHRDEADSLQQALQHHCFEIALTSAGSLIHQIPATSEHACLQLPSLHQALKPQHIDASDSNRQALKRHPVANAVPDASEPRCCGWERAVGRHSDDRRRRHATLCSATKPTPKQP